MKSYSVEIHRYADNTVIAEDTLGDPKLLTK